ncbi:MAG TPA: hypothetical protein VGV60_03750 [Candidatus Polarisedimenticolia bacterium]|jgi:hypothetical protein|nr:hypothetical protein [Candidatus Polarisedimenticolia bacterium]
MNITRIAAVVSLVGMIAAATGPLVAGDAQEDACLRAVPESLSGQISSIFPSYRLIQAGDYSADVVKAEKKNHKGGPCLGVANGNFDGRNAKDFAFLLVSPGKPPLLVAARATADKGWTFQELLKLGQDAPGRNYVDIVPPGKYQDRLADRPGDSKGWTSNYVSAFQGVGVGHFGSPGVALFFNGTDWVRLRLGN